MASPSTVAPSSFKPRSTTCFSSSRLRCSRRKTRLRESRGAMTSNEGFSVVAPTSVMVPSSTWGRMASCCALLKRWISSMKSTVRRPARRCTRASATTLRRSATPAVTADMATIRALVSVARRRARVVLPLPGGPHRTMLGRWPERVSCLSTSTTRRCPTRSSKLTGRNRVARGALGSAPGGRGKSSPWSVMRRLSSERDIGARSLQSAHGHLLVLQLGGSRDLPVLRELRSQPDRPHVEPSFRGGRPHHRASGTRSSSTRWSARRPTGRCGITDPCRWW